MGARRLASPDLARRHGRGAAREEMTKGAQPLAEDAAFLRKLKPSLMVTRAKGEGPNPFLVVGIALAAGIALAKIVDWRGHAHPRD